MLAFLIDHDHAFAGLGYLGRGDKTGKPGSDHDYVCIASHYSPLRSPNRLKRRARLAVNDKRCPKPSHDAATRSLDVFRSDLLRARVQPTGNT